MSISARVEQAIEDFRNGKMIILVDDEDRENEGDFCIAAEYVTPDDINFMATHARGLICLALTQKRAEYLELGAMVQDNTSSFGTAFTVSIEARTGVSTGISAADRARTIRVAVNNDSTPKDLVRPGHVFPLTARDGGVLVRTGQTEGVVDLARLSGLTPAGVICEIMKDDGTMARMPDLEKFAKKHNMLILSIADLIEYRLTRECLVEKVDEVPLPCEFGENFKASVFRNSLDGTTHLAITKGSFSQDDEVLVRVQSQFILADVFRSLTVDDGAQLAQALQRINEEGSGILLYIISSDRDLSWELKQVQRKRASDENEDNPDPEGVNRPKPQLRNFGIGAQILRSLGVRKLRLMTNNPKKIKGLAGYGLTVVERQPIEVKPTSENIGYLVSKQEEMGHIMSIKPPTQV